MSFLRVAAASALSKPAAVLSNCEQITDCIRDCRSKGVQLLVLPKLSLSAATCGDLFFDEALLSQVKEGLSRIIEESRDMLIILGLPIKKKHEVYNAAAIINNRELLGFVHSGRFIKSDFTKEEKTYSCDEETVDVMGVSICFADTTKISCRQKDSEERIDVFISFSDGDTVFDKEVFKHEADINCVLGAVCSRAGMRSLIETNLSSASRLTASACIFSNASSMESSTDYVFEGELCIAETGEVIADNFISFEQVIIADIDMDRIRAFKQNRRQREEDFYEEVFEAEIQNGPDLSGIQRKISIQPYLPEDEKKKRDYLADILRLQYRGLSKRLRATGIDKVIIGMSGGLDSTAALISTVHTFKLMGIDTKHITALMLPCFGSSDRTKNNALSLCEELKITYQVIDIKASVLQHFIDIGHDENHFNACFENAQARERTQVLMDMANDIGALVIGTSDMSEIALGFSTYGGDHIAMYGMNNSLPKTVLQELIKYMADEYRARNEERIAGLLLDICRTPISPELLPTKNNEIAQKTEDIIGPYELHDFFLYYFLKYRYRPSKIFELAFHVFQGKYTRQEIIDCLRVFYKRFFAAQFKRSCSYDAPNLMGLSLSPRGEFHMPSDAVAELWLNEIEGLERE